MRLELEIENILRTDAYTRAVVVARGDVRFQRFSPWL